MQAKHPMLTVGVRKDEENRPWFVTPDKIPEIPVRIETRHTHESWIQEARTELATPFDTASGPLMRVTWLRADKVSDLLLTVHHCAADGTTGITLMNELLLLLDDPDAGIGSETLFTGVQQVIPAALFNNRLYRFKIKLKTAIVKMVFNCMAAFTPAKKEMPQREKDYIIYWKLGQAMSSALLRRCVAAQVTPHSALCVAFLSAFQQVKGKRALGRVTCPADIRHFMREIKQDTVFSYGMAIDAGLKTGSRETFWQKVKRMHHDLSRKTGKLKPYEQLLIFEQLHSLLPKMLRFLRNSKPREDVMFSNLGRLNIPKSFRSFEVEEVYSPAVIGPFSNPCTIMASTFRGQMSFSFISNETVLHFDEATAIKNKAMELLEQQLEITATPGTVLNTNTTNQLI